MGFICPKTVSYTPLDVYKRQFEDKKKPPSKLSQGVKEAPVHLVAGKFHKEIRETEQDNVGVESAHKSEEAVETSAYPVSYTHLRMP